MNPLSRFGVALSAMALLASIVVLPVTPAYAQSQNEVLTTVLYDGTQFDTDPLDDGSGNGVHTPGLDGNAQNNVVKTHDTFAVRVDWNVNEDETSGALLTVVIPPFATWAPDATGMFAGCDPAASSFPDAQTLICSLGDQLEGSNGAIRPIAQLNDAVDATTFDVVSTLTTDDDATGVVDGLDNPLVVSEAPVANWLKAEPEIALTSSGDYVFLYPLTLIDFSQGDTPILGAGAISSANPINMFDHAYSFPASATVATTAQMAQAGFAGRSSCGAYDGAGAYPITAGTWTCGATTTSAGYPVVPIDITGFATVPAPALNADGTPNSAGAGVHALTGQIALFLPAADADAEIASADNVAVGVAQFDNALAQQDDSAPIASQDDILPIQIPGSSGPVDESATVSPDGEDPADNVAQGFIGTSPVAGSPGATIGHDIRFVPGPLQVLETYRYDDGTLPRHSADLRSRSQGGMFYLPGATTSIANTNSGDFIGETPRGATVTINSQVLALATAPTNTWDAPIQGCTAFDTTHYVLTEFADIPVTQTVPFAAANNPAAAGGYTTTSNTGPLAHVYTGAASSLYHAFRGQHSAVGGVRSGLEYTVEFTDAPLQLVGAQFGVNDDELTCNDSDAGSSGWVDAAGDLSVFDTVDSGDGLYEGITRARVRITERFPWLGNQEAGNAYTGFQAYFQAAVKTDLSVQTVDQELFALQSHSFGDLGADGVPDLVPFIGSPSLEHCAPYSTAQWETTGNMRESSTGYCNNTFIDDGANSLDDSEAVGPDWDNRASTRTTTNPAGVTSALNSSGSVISIVEAALGITKSNNAGLGDVKNNGQLVEFTISPRVVGSGLEALTNVRLSDSLPANYTFVQFLSQPATGPGCVEAGDVISCQFSEPNPAVDSDPTLPAGLAGGWSDSFEIQVMVTGAIADPESPVVITNTARVDSSGLGPWDPATETFVGDVQTAAKSASNSANSFLPLPADEGAIIKAVDTLEGPCDVHPTEDPAPAGWDARCSKISQDDNMTFLLSLTNEGNTAFTDIEIVDVFPFNGDGASEPDSNTPNQGGSVPTVGDARTPGSDFTGSLAFVSMDAVSNAAALTTWVSGDDPATISRDPAVTVGAAANTWCDAPGGTVQVGTGACPATAEDVTATYSVVDGPLNPAQTLELRLTLDAEDSTCGDHWTNTFGARVPQILLPIRSNDVTIMIECEVDLALEKVLDPAFAPGADWITEGVTTVDFLIEVTNQGDPVEDFDITDYIDTAVWSFDPANNADGTTTGTALLPYTWDVTDPAKPVASVDGRFEDGTSLTIPVTLTLESTVGPFENVAEISYFDVDGDPTNGDSDPDNAANPSAGPLTDIDSTPDDEDGNGPGEDLATDMVDGETAEDGNDGGDEDDHDIAIVPVFDIELVKTARDPVDITVDPWEATFDITVTNQGNQPVFLVDVTEYAPAGLTYDPASTAALWATEAITGVTDASPTFTIAGPIAPGDSVVIPLVFDIIDYTASPYLNAAEVSAFDSDDDPANAADPFAVDIDSTPDDSNDDEVIDHVDPNYDPDGDGNLNEATPGDEDDHDVAELKLPIDMELRKRVDPTDADLLDGIQNGDEITFFVEVFNRAGPIEDFHVTDYISSGWVFDPALNGPGVTTAGSLGGPALPFTWDSTDPTAAVAMVDGALGTAESVFIPVTLTVSIDDVTDELFNTAEISYFDDDGDPSNGDSDPDNANNPVGGPLTDVDSTPDGDVANDALEDDVTDENSVVGDLSGDGTVDEDDHDIASTKWWDLALIKERSADQPYLLDPDAVPLQVSFDITVKNQGPEDAVNIDVVDTPPGGLTFASLTDATGTVTGSGAPFSISALAAGETVTFTATYDIDLATLETPSVNTAEISNFQGETDPDGPAGPLEPGVYDIVDIDSVSDDDPTNDAITTDGVTDPADSHNNIDNDPEGDGLHDADGIDEDDHDTEAFVVPFDLALVKTFVAMDSPLIPGGTATMLITITNQGPPIEVVDVVDYLDPASWQGFDPALNPDGPMDASSTAAAAFSFVWDATDPANPVARLTPDTAGDKLVFGETIAVPITVTISPDFDTATQLINVAEVAYFDSDGDPTNGDSNPDNPDNPTTGPLVDGDSTPDTTNGSGPGETIGGDLVDDDVDGDGSEGTDEDDHDVVVIPVMDLALRKSLDPSTEFPIFAGQPVTFSFEFINQGNVDVSAATLVEYVDLTMWTPFDAGINPDGTTGGDAAVPYTWAADGTDGVLAIDGTIGVGQSVTVSVTLVIVDGADLETLSNAGEITGGIATIDDDGDPATPPVEVTNPDGSTVVDIDSTPDATNDDSTVDDEVSNGGGDEDDHDIAFVTPPTYSLGNQVWFDADNNGMLDAGEEPIEGVTVELFVDADGDGVPDDTNGDGVVDSADAVATTTTGADGEYLFEDLQPGDYVVGIPPSMWDPTGPLYASIPSQPVSTDPNDDVDNDSNGVVGAGGYVFSGPVTLDDSEPAGEAGLNNDPNNPDVLSNLTVDFGFWAPVFDLALTKSLAAGQSDSVTVGDTVTYTITILNQGDVAASNVGVIDYLPTGTTLNDPDWTLQADGTATTVVAGPVAAGSSVTVDITVTITAAGSLMNSAEITGATPLDADGNEIVMPTGVPLPDADSVADATNDDTVSDDETNGANGDEDDHDIAVLAAVAAPDDLARTGSNVRLIVTIGLLLMAFGGLLIFGRRRTAA